MCVFVCICSIISTFVLHVTFRYNLVVFRFAFLLGEIFGLEYRKGITYNLFLIYPTAMGHFMADLAMDIFVSLIQDNFGLNVEDEMVT